MLLEPVRQGDIVDIIAPASQCTKAELRSAIKALKNLGLVPRVPRHIFAKSLLFSNTDKVRLAHLKKALYARDSKMIWCARGGYGSLRLMNELEKWKRPARPKIFLGYSDITTLHSFLNQRWKWPTYHGPLLDRLGRGAMSPKERRELLSLIFGLAGEFEFRNLVPMNKAARAKRSIKGTILGGNLTTLQSSLGTRSEFKPGKCILFLEDTGERPHRVDRMLTQAQQAGWFKDVRAVVFGYFQLFNAKDKRGLWNDVMARFAAENSFPVYKGLKVGHDPKIQYTLPFNTSARIESGSKASLIVASGIKPR